MLQRYLLLAADFEFEIEVSECSFGALWIQIGIMDPN